MNSLAIFGLPNSVKQQSRTEHLYISGQFGGESGLLDPPPPSNSCHISPDWKLDLETSDSPVSGAFIHSCEGFMLMSVSEQPIELCQTTMTNVKLWAEVVSLSYVIFPLMVLNQKAEKKKMPVSTFEKASNNNIFVQALK